MSVPSVDGYVTCVDAVVRWGRDPRAGPDHGVRSPPDQRKRLGGRAKEVSVTKASGSPASASAPTIAPSSGSGTARRNDPSRVVLVEAGDRVEARPHEQSVTAGHDRLDDRVLGLGHERSPVIASGLVERGGHDPTPVGPEGRDPDQAVAVDLRGRCGHRLALDDRGPGARSSVEQMDIGAAPADRHVDERPSAVAGQASRRARRCRRRPTPRVRGSNTIGSSAGSAPRACFRTWRP